MGATDLLRAYALVGIPVGLATGLGLGLVARRPDGWGGYASFPRRATRLAHVCLVMLPVIAGAYAQGLAGVPASAALSIAAWTWVVAGPALATALFLVAWRPALRAALVAPAVSVTASAVAFAACALA
jgi:hypothetical protein